MGVVMGLDSLIIFPFHCWAGLPCLFFACIWRVILIGSVCSFLHIP